MVLLHRLYSHVCTIVCQGHIYIYIDVEFYADSNNKKLAAKWHRQTGSFGEWHRQTKFGPSLLTEFFHLEPLIGGQVV